MKARNSTSRITVHRGSALGSGGPKKIREECSPIPNE